MFLFRRSKQEKLVQTNRGFVLVITLWTITMLSIFAIYLSYRASTVLNITKRLNQRLDSYYLAKAGVDYAIDLLRNDQDEAADYLTEPWAEMQTQELGNGTFTVDIIDTGRKIDINTLAGLIQSDPVSGLDVGVTILMGITGFDVDKAIAALDWIDGNANQRPRSFGDIPPGEDSDFYFTSDEKIKNGNLQFLEELLIIKEMTIDNYKSCSDFLTVDENNEQLVNINTVQFNEEEQSCPVLSALGITEDLIMRIFQLRSDNDYIGNIDDIGGAFFTEGRNADLKIYLGVTSNTYTIISQGKVGDFQDGFRIEATYDKVSDKIIDWQEEFVVKEEEVDEDV